MIRRVLDSDVYPTLQDSVSELLSQATTLADQIRAIGNSYGQEAECLANMSGLATAPIGIELVDGEYLRQLYDRVVREAGGIEAIENQLLESFLAKCLSPGSITEQNHEDIREKILEICEPIFVGLLQRSDVESALKEAAGAPEALGEYVLQVIQESAGRLPMPQVYGDESKCLEMLAVPQPARFEWLRTLANGLDPEPGEWHLVSNGNDAGFTSFSAEPPFR